MFAIAAGRVTRRVVLLLRPGGGTAIPGRVVEKLSPGLLGRILRQPRLIAVTGSNGKGTTTKMLVAILDAHGVDVFTNKYAGNITRGMLSELLRVVDWRGRFPHEVAVMEMDEGYSALTTEEAPAEVTVLLNVMIDQLHRWQSPERVAEYLERTARATRGTVVINREDPHLRRIAAGLPSAQGRTLRYFGVAPEVIATVRSGLGSAPAFGPEPEALPTGVGGSTVVAHGGLAARIEIADHRGETVVLDTELPSRGIHFAIDQAAAIEAARAVLADDFDPARAAAALSSLPTIFGRGERVEVRGEPAELILAKSPTSFQINLDVLDPDMEQFYVNVGRDVPDGSQLWLTDWSEVAHVDMLSGDQLWEMALKLAYDEVEIRQIDEDFERATDVFFAMPTPERGVKTVIYTAQSMRRMRRYLGFFSADTEKEPVE